jgi:YHS domain-containing protein
MTFLTFPIRRHLLMAMSALAADTMIVSPLLAQNAKSAINVLAGGRVAIHGYDPVAYLVDGGPRKGRSDLAVEHGGARWLFASEENRRRFEADPARYIPAYGGYCAYGVAQGYLVKIDPEAWSVVDGRVYLNYDKPVQQSWLKDVPGYVAAANVNWPKLTGRQ